LETYLVVRAHGLKTRLLGRADYEAIVRGNRSLSSFNDYRGFNEESDIKEKVNSVYRVYISRMKLLSSVAPDYGVFIDALLDRLEIENVKIQLRNIVGERRKPFFYPYGRVLAPARLSEVATENELWELLKKTPYYRGGKTPSFVTGSVAEKEFFLDNLYYLYLLQILSEGFFSKKLVPVLDVVRTEYLVRLFYWKIALGGAFQRLLDVFPKPFTVSKSAFDAMIKKLKVESEEVEDLINRRRLTELLNRLTLALIRYTEYKLRPYSVELPYIYLFNMMAYVEAKNLERVIIGLDAGLQEETILSSLVFFK